MPTVTDAANNSLIISRSAAWEAFRDALRMFVGKGKRYSVQQAATGSGVAYRMIQAFMAPIDSTDWRKPDLEEVLSLASFIGPEFTSEVLHCASQGAFWLPEADDLSPGALAADLAEGAAKVTRAAADNDFNRDERRDLRPVGRALMVVGAQLEAQGRAA